MNLETWKRTAHVYKTKLRPTDPHLRVVLPRNYTGCIMGFKGQFARKLQEECNVFLQIHNIEGAKWGRVVSIKGEPLTLSRAWYECGVSLIENHTPQYKLHGFSIDFVLPSDLIDLFILQDDFQRIANATNTKILVKHDCLMRSTERVVRVTTENLGAESLRSFKKFVFLLAQLVADNITISLCAPGNVFYMEDIQDDIISYIKDDNISDLVFYPTEEDTNHQQYTFDSYNRTNGYSHCGRKEDDNVCSSSNDEDSNSEKNEQIYYYGRENNSEANREQSEADPLESSEETDDEHVVEINERSNEEINEEDSVDKDEEYSEDKNKIQSVEIKESHSAAISESVELDNNDTLEINEQYTENDNEIHKNVANRESSEKIDSKSAINNVEKELEGESSKYSSREEEGQADEAEYIDEQTHLDSDNRKQPIQEDSMSESLEQGSAASEETKITDVVEENINTHIEKGVDSPKVEKTEMKATGSAKYESDGESFHDTQKQIIRRQSAVDIHQK